MRDSDGQAAVSGYGTNYDWIRALGNKRSRDHPIYVPLKAPAAPHYYAAKKHSTGAKGQDSDKRRMRLPLLSAFPSCPRSFSRERLFEPGMRCPYS